MTIPTKPTYQYPFMEPQPKSPWLRPGSWRDQVRDDFTSPVGVILAGNWQAARDVVNDLGLNPASWVYAEPSNTKTVRGGFIQTVIVDAGTVGTVPRETVAELNRLAAGRIRWHWVDRNVT